MLRASIVLRVLSLLSLSNVLIALRVLTLLNVLIALRVLKSVKGHKKSTVLQKENGGQRQFKRTKLRPQVDDTCRLKIQ